MHNGHIKARTSTKNNYCLQTPGKKQIYPLLAQQTILQLCLFAHLLKKLFAMKLTNVVSIFFILYKNQEATYSF